jgi:hypothetical protein
VEAAADTLDFGQVAPATQRTRRTAAATGTNESTAKAAKAAQADKAAAELAAAQPGRLPATRAEGDMPAAANSNQGQPQFRIIKADTSASALYARASVDARDDRANTSADQVVASLTSIDSPRRTAEIYHKVAEAARPGSDAPTPADQVSIRLIHAVRQGAIQMHLHPADLLDRSQDAVAGRQVDRAIPVDRPETLQTARGPRARAPSVRPGSIVYSGSPRPRCASRAKSNGEGFDQPPPTPSDGGEPGRRRAVRPGDPRRYSQHPRVGQDGPHGHRLTLSILPAPRPAPPTRPQARRPPTTPSTLLTAQLKFQDPLAPLDHPVHQPAQPVLGRAGHRRNQNPDRSSSRWASTR